MALDDAGYAQELGEELQLRQAFEKEDRSKERRDFEHRSGFELWGGRFTVVTCLTLNMRTEGMLADILKGMRDTIIVAESQAEIEAIEVETRCINSIVLDDEFRADSSNLDYRIGRP